MSAPTPAQVNKKQETIRWTMSPKASVIIKGEKLSEKPLLALYSQCEVIKPRSPSLQVREKS